MTLSRDVLAWVSVGAGAAVAMVLIRWFPVMPPPSFPSSAAPLASSFQIPSRLRETASSPENKYSSVFKKEDKSPLIARPARPVTSGGQVNPLSAESPVVDVRIPTEIHPPSSVHASAAVRSPAQASLRPETTPAPAPQIFPPVTETRVTNAPAARPPIDIQVPIPIVSPPPSHPAGMRVRVGDVSAFKAKVAEAADRVSARIVMDGSTIRISVSSDSRAALKESINAAIFEYLSESGTETRIEIISE